MVDKLRKWKQCVYKDEITFLLECYVFLLLWLQIIYLTTGFDYVPIGGRYQIDYLIPSWVSINLCYYLVSVI